MFIFNGGRHEMLACLPECKKIAELGVFNGQNAAFMYNHFLPDQMELIDAWNSDLMKKGYCQFDELPEGVSPLSDFAPYFGGDPNEQATMDALYNTTKELFQNSSKTNIVRENTHTAVNHYEDGHFDLLYIDANHQYEYVLQDLHLWEKKLAPTGFIALNDCVSSPEGRKQNLGVLEAFSAFLKSTNFVPLSLSMTSFSDLIITRTDNPLMGYFLMDLIKTGNCIEVPNSFVHSFSLKQLSDDVSYFSFD